MSGYSGYSDDRYAEAERLRERDESRKLVIALWPEQMNYNIAGQSPGCEFCSRVLVVSKKDPSKYMCPDCGNLTDIAPPKVSKPRTFKPKQNAKPSLIIASQPDKRRSKKPGSVSDVDAETRADLKLLGMIDDANLQEY